MIALNIHGDRDVRDGDRGGDVLRERRAHTPFRCSALVCGHAQVCVAQFRLAVDEFLVLSLGMEHVSRLEHEQFSPLALGRGVELSLHLFKFIEMRLPIVHSIKEYLVRQMLNNPNKTYMELGYQHALGMVCQLKTEIKSCD